MAKQLIQSMTSEWQPEQCTDEYHKVLKKMIHEKIEHGGEQLPVPAKKKSDQRRRPGVRALQQKYSASAGKTEAGDILFKRAKHAAQITAFPKWSR